MVYYLAVHEILVGHCIIAPGSRRLKRSTKQDIVVGPYLIEQNQRRKGYSKPLVQLSLEYCSYEYDSVYAYIAKDNIASIKTIESCGFHICGELDIIGPFHRLVEKSTGDGSYSIYRKMKSEGTI